MKKKNKIIIAGPCAAESRELILLSARQAQKRNISFMRVNLWKPRTKPGFDGIGDEGLPLLVEVAKLGINPGLEVITPEHAKKVLKFLLPSLGDRKVLLWIGARNQNHFFQKKISKIASHDKRVYLLVKNQPWKDENHWEGIIEHVLDGGIPKDRLILCDRGFAPSCDNPNNYRNIPDHEMAMRIKEKFDLPMVFDPSHTGGSVENVFNIVNSSIQFNYDGILTEVHTNPKKAITDSKQQITWAEFDKIIDIISP